MSTELWQQTLPALTGDTAVTPRAVTGAIRMAFSLEHDPKLLGITLRKAFEGYRATIHLAGFGKTPGERRKWVMDQFYPRWRELERMTGVKLYMRRNWQG
ncbi:MAG: hypothetical protein ABI743_11995 [bacterium]